MTRGDKQPSHRLSLVFRPQIRGRNTYQVTCGQSGHVRVQLGVPVLLLLTPLSLGDIFYLLSMLAIYNVCFWLVENAEDDYLRCTCTYLLLFVLWFNKGGYMMRIMFNCSQYVRFMMVIVGYQTVDKWGKQIPHRLPLVSPVITEYSQTYLY